MSCAKTSQAKPIRHCSAFRKQIDWPVKISDVAIDSAASQDINTPNIGDDIDLNELTDAENDKPEESEYECCPYLRNA